MTITCSGCQQMMAITEAMAGKKVKCPACGQVTALPATIAVAQQEVAPPPVDAPTNPPLDQPDATQGVDPDDGDSDGDDDANLTDFLAPPQAPDELGRLGAFRILKILGRGGMGVVFLGDDPTLGRKVAIKAMLPHLGHSKSSRSRFLREARAAAALEHDNIVAIHYVGEDRGAPYIVMPFLKGQPLDERLKNGVPIALLDILRIGREIAGALDAAHKTGLIHRDIKPANIWLETSAARGLALGESDPSAKPQAAGEGRVKILDFGLARASSPGDAGLTQQGAIVGTPAYMAPEQGRGDGVDARSDLFSLGIVLYRLCTGKPPFVGKDTMSTLMAIASVEPPAPITINRELPAELSDLVMKLLEKEREKRVQSAAETVRSLEALEKELIRKKEAKENTVALALPILRKKVIDEALFAIDKTLPGEPSRVSGGVSPAPSPSSTGPLRGSARRPIIAIAVAAVFALFCIVGAGGIFYVVTDKGTIEIKTDDEDIKILVLRNGKEIEILDPKTKKTWTLSTGDYTLKIKDDPEGFEIALPKDQAFELKRGGKQVVSIRKVAPMAKNDSKDVPASEPKKTSADGRFVSLFNGKDLTGWTALPRGDDAWKVEQGAITCTASDRSFLFTERGDFTDFHLRVEAKISKLGVGGVLFRSKLSMPSRPAGPGEGLDARICATKQKYRTGSLSSFAATLAPVPPADEWFDMEIIAKGDSVTILVNGQKAGDYQFKRQINAMGHIALQHLTAGTKVYFRKIEIKDPRTNDVPAAKTPVYVPRTPEEKDAQQLQRDWAKKLNREVETASPSAIVMVVIPPDGKALPKPYLMGKFEVTQSEWEAVMGYNPSVFKKGRKEVEGMDTSRFPVDSVSWYESVEFCNKLSEKEGLKPYYELKVTTRGSNKQIDAAGVTILGGLGYHIPTDAEWEHACRAGSKTKYHFGDKDEELPEYAWFDKNSEQRSHRVGELKPNAFGLYDMHGNVREWNEEMLTNATGGAPESVTRGGSWHYRADSCAVAPLGYRHAPASRFHFGGVRLARRFPPELVEPGPWQPLLDANLSDWNLKNAKDADAVTVTPIDGEPVLKMRRAPDQSGPYVSLKKHVQNHHLTLDFQFPGKEPATLYVGYTWGKEGKYLIQFQIDSNGKARRAVGNLRANDALLEHGVIVTGPPGKVKIADAILEPAGAWNRLDLVRIDDRVACFVNGRFLAALAGLRELDDGKEAAPGKTSITILGAKGEVQIRRIAIRDINALPPELVARAPFPPLDPLWEKAVAAMKPEQQIEAVKAELMKRNPGFDGKMLPMIDKNNGPVTELHFLTDNVTDISPVRAFPALKSLKVWGTHPNWWDRNGKLADLSPLKGMELSSLELRGTQVSDLSPLKGMNLTFMSCQLTNVADLSPLQGMKLTTLHCEHAKVADLTPLKGMPLTYLRLESTLVTDLSPLAGMPLAHLHCSDTKVRSLAPLGGMKLTELGFNRTPVADLSPLKNMPLESLYCDVDLKRDGAMLRAIKTLKKVNNQPADKVLSGAAGAFAPLDPAWLKAVAAMKPEQRAEAVKAELMKRNPGFDGKLVTHKLDEAGVVTELKFVTDDVTDLSPVRAFTRLKWLHCSASNGGKGKLADLSPLRDMKIENLGLNATQVSDLLPLQNMRLKTLWFIDTQVTDLTPLIGMKDDLTKLGFGGTNVSDLSPLKGMTKLETLLIHKTLVADLSPLKGLKLRHLMIQNTSVSDLSPLRGMPLKEISCDFNAGRDAAILRSIKTLETINGKDAKDVLK